MYGTFLLLFVCWGEEGLKSNHRGSNILSSWIVHAGLVLLPAFTRLGHECQDLLSPCDGMHMCTDLTWAYTLIQKSFRGNGVRTHVNSKVKIPSTGGSEEDRTHDAP